MEVLRREVEAMDGRKALRPRMGRTARSSRSKTGARGPVAQRRAGCRSRRFLVTFFQEKIGIGGSPLAAPLPHHPACGSAPGGSRTPDQIRRGSPIRSNQATVSTP